MAKPYQPFLSQDVFQDVIPRRALNSDIGVLSSILVEQIHLIMILSVLTSLLVSSVVTGQVSLAWSKTPRTPAVKTFPRNFKEMLLFERTGSNSLNFSMKFYSGSDSIHATTIVTNHVSKITKSGH